MTSSVSSNITLDNLLKVNQLPDSAVEKIKQTFSKDESKVEDSDEVYEETDDETEEDDSVVFDYNSSISNTKIANYIKKYTSAITDYLNYASENKIPLNESPLKDVLKNKFKIKIARSAYDNVGMGEYYSLKKMLTSMQPLNNNNGSSDIIKNLTNFTISV